MYVYIYIFIYMCMYCDFLKPAPLGTTSGDRSLCTGMSDWRETVLPGEIRVGLLPVEPMSEVKRTQT